MENKKNILVVGNSLATISLIKILRLCETIGEIFATLPQSLVPSGVTSVDIREEKVEELLSFAFNNNVALTIVTSKNAIKVDIAGVFSANGQMVFAPDAQSSKQIIDEALAKKFLYKLRIPTSKFGTFEKPQLAVDYLKTANFPLVVKAAEPLTERDLYACPTVSVANIAINDLFFRAENKILIEEFLNGHNFNFYVVTDGYRALPLGAVTSYKFLDEINGGYLTFGSGACLPDFKLTKDLEDKLMRDVVTRLLGALEKNGTPYVGILGLNCVLQEDKIFVQRLSTFFEDVDAPAILATLDENLFAMFEACAMGVFADDYDVIKTNDMAAVSLAIFARDEGKKIAGIDNLDMPENLNLDIKHINGEIYTQKGLNATLGASASTLARAKRVLADEIECLQFEGKKYRKDLLK